jgi:hypothetical protein
MPERGRTVGTWAQLQTHFALHKRLVRRFRRCEREAVAHMWRTQSNELGEPLTGFEREALVERHCELFGVWPG